MIFNGEVKLGCLEEDVGARVGTFEKLVALDNLVDILDLCKLSHASMLHAKAIEIGISKEAIENFIFHKSGLRYPEGHEDVDRMRREKMK